MSPQQPKSSRFYFIDAARAVAILMMLQGHFVDRLLNPVYRDVTDPVYATWAFFRGITAPLFFTVSGLIFVFLLLREADKGFWKNPRVRRGLKRGVELIFWGYLLRVNIFYLGMGRINASFWVVDVLHCIGLALIASIGLYALWLKVKQVPFSLLLLSIGCLLFLFEPLYSAWNPSGIPQWLVHYVTDQKGAVFTPFPWIGYTLIGGAFGAFLRQAPKLGRTWAGPVGLFIFGILLTWLSSPFFSWLFEQTGIDLFQQIVWNNYLFIRLGNVFIVLALFWLLEQATILTARWRLLLKIGRETLLIYQVHYVLLYGSWFGLGLVGLYSKQLGPVEAAVGAACFVAFFVGLIYTLEEWKAFFHDKVHQLGVTVDGLIHQGRKVRRALVIRRLARARR
ncbi:MAG: heparan-alpha-glucosaminide N-acetyltransferase domain-containing protein [Bacteroidota bacterium]